MEQQCHVIMRHYVQFLITGNYVLMSYTIVIGVSLAAAVLSMSVLVVGVMCQYVCTRKNLKVHRSYGKNNYCEWYIIVN